jgi:hypothetical protein
VDGAELDCRANAVCSWAAIGIGRLGRETLGHDDYYYDSRRRLKEGGHDDGP